MRKLLFATIMLGAVLWAQWTGVCGPVPWWVKDNTGLQSGYKYRGICVISDSLAWVVGEYGQVWKRTGGVHSHQWKDMTDTIPNGRKNHFNDICFIGNNGWLVGEKKHDATIPESLWYKGIVYRTINGGASWDSLPTPPLPLPTPFLKVKMANVQVGYITCGNGIVLKTEDGGASWSRTISDPWGDANNISVWYCGLWVEPGNSDHLWVSGDAFGIIAKSINGGANWTACSTSAFSQTYTFPPPTSTPYGTKLGFFDVDFTNPNNGMVALSYGKVGKTATGGVSWSVTQYATFCGQVKICCKMVEKVAS